MKKVKVLIDLYYYKAAVSGIRSYISELKDSSEDHGSEQIQYIFSHDIKKLSFNKTYLNSSNRFIRWVFQLNYLVYKQIFLPIKLLIIKPDYLICSDYVAPILSFNTKKNKISNGGAIVNSKIVPLDYKLKTGDIVNMKTSKNSFGPNDNWLKIVKTSNAKSKIKNYLNKRRRDVLVEMGKDDFNKELNSSDPA